MDLERFKDNTTEEWLAAVLVAVGVLAALLVGRWALLAFTERGPQQGAATRAREVVAMLERRTHIVVLAIVAVYAGSRLITMPDQVDNAVRTITVLTLVLQAGLWASSAITIWTRWYQERTAESAVTGALDAARYIGTLVLWALLFILALDNVGVQVTALVAGLGIGGIAIALAAQSVLGDLFASLAIVLDRPFAPGDFIVVGDMAGSVERVGIKSTRVRSLSGEQLIFGNSDLLNSRIHNYGRMVERRVVFTLGVTYDTPAERVEAIPGIVRTAIEAQPSARFDRAHFHAYGESALNIEAVYYVLSPDYGAYMDTQQAINLQLLNRFRQEGIEFAFPTRTVHVYGEPAAAAGS
jgi:small-conductance mechanosensitive channel